MKLTWFGGTTIRIHLGGAILVLDAEGAPAWIDRAELVSGADRVIAGFGAALEVIDAGAWKPPRVRPLEADAAPVGVAAYRVGDRALLVHADGEAPLLLMAGEPPLTGRWVGDAVVVLFGDGAALAERGAAVLESTPPRLIALAGDEAAIDAAIPALRDRLDGAGLVALEAGLALEA